VSRYRCEGILILWAFFLLALGDTGHVGFRVMAFISGGLEKNGTLVGLGALATAITVTFFYVLVLFLWKVRFKTKLGLIGCILLLAAAVRLIVMCFPQNQWASVVPPFEWSLYRNIPLMVQGIGAGVLILISAIRNNDAVFKRISLWIFVSYLCYIPVILFIQKVPVIGMLMIPKTLAYHAVALIGYKNYFASNIQIKENKSL
jgi:hypothetical protein